MARINDEILNYESIYTNDGVLDNKFGYKDENILNKAERMITSRKLALLYLNPGLQTFDADHYIRIHKFLFEDIYYFAGEIRSENISKRITFCPPQYIYKSLSEILKKANQIVSTIDSREKLLIFITELYSDLDVIHPFREGNGRCEREFIRQFIEYICKINSLEYYELRYDKIKDRDEYIDAVVKADSSLDYSDLIKLFDSILLTKEEQIISRK